MFNKIFKIFKENIQINQTLILSFLLFLGVYFFKLDISILEIVTIFSTVIILDAIILYKIKWNFVFPFSWINAWFWISFFLRSDDLIIYIFAGVIAILWKYLITHKWKHFLNPSNMAVFISLIIFPQIAWTNPLQWGQSVELQKYILAIFSVLILWFFIINRLKKILKFNFLDLIFSFTLTHILLFLTITQESSLNSFLLFFNVSFLIFVFFMLTDPKTNLKTSIFRLLYWSAVAITFYILQFFINENYSLLWSLFFMTLLLPFLRLIEDYYIENKAKKSIYFFLIFIVFLLILLSYLYIIEWPIDLLFDNRCNMLFCN